MIGDFQVFFHMATDSAPNPLIRFLSSSAPTKIFTARVKNLAEIFCLMKISSGISNKGLKSRIDIFVRNKILRCDLRQYKTGKDNNNGANRCF